VKKRNRSGKRRGLSKEVENLKAKRGRGGCWGVSIILRELHPWVHRANESELENGGRKNRRDLTRGAFGADEENKTITSWVE